MCFDNETLEIFVMLYSVFIKNILRYLHSPLIILVQHVNSTKDQLHKNMSKLIFNFEIMNRDFNFYEIAVFLSHWWSRNYREQRANVREYPLPIKGIIS